MRKHGPSLLAAGISLGIFFGLVGFGIPNAPTVASWLAFGTFVSGAIGSVIYNYSFRIDTYALGLCGGALAIGLAAEQLKNAPAPARKLEQVQEHVKPMKAAFYRASKGMPITAQSHSCVNRFKPSASLSAQL